ncbi:MAG: hypothetical protein R3F62_05780 [Planctomycetota bacterium]
MTPKTPALALALVASLVAAQDAGADERRPAIVRHDPLRLELEDPRSMAQRIPVVGQAAPEDPWDGVMPREAIPAELASILARPELADQRVQLLLSSGSRPRALRGTTRADVTLLGSLGLGAETAGVVRSNEPVVVVGEATSTSPTGATLRYFKVRRGSAVAYAPASQILIGEKTGLGTAIGDAVGDALAPAFALGTRIRRDRFFHPEGDVFRARVESLAPAKFRATAQGMEGAALIRVGKGFFRNTAWMPTLSLGMAIRFYDPQAGGPPTTPRANDFDLLVVSWAERFNHLLWRTPFQTDTGDFFGNEYYPAIPYRVEGEEVWVRVVPAEVESKGPSPLGKLLAATEAGEAVFYLEIQGEPERVKTRRGTRPKPRVWTRLAKITFEEQLADFDQDALHYSPGMAGRGFEPTGLVTRIRRPVYRASQDVREGLVDELEDQE